MTQPANCWQFAAPDARVLDEARARQARLTKPAGSLGVLEDLAVQLAAWQGCPRPSARPSALPGMVFSHCSNEKAHAGVLEALAARPLLSLDLRLGEASGALLAFPLLDLACALHTDMATFESAGVPERSG